MKRLLVLAAVLAVAATAAYAAPPPGKEETKKSATSSAQSQAQKVKDNPAKTCQKERSELGVDAFGKKYGTNHNLRNAFGKCVSGKSKAKDETEKDEKDEKDESSAAAKQCTKERSDMGETAFASRYGTNHNKANAFGKCVSSKSKEGNDD
jgi:opacity protein-like surface antigen